MSLANNLRLRRPHTTTLAPYSERLGCRISLVKTRALDKRHSALLEKSTSYSDSSDDERATTSSGSADAGRILFDGNHVSAWSPELLLYAPVGILVAALRSALWILGIALDQPWFRNQAVVDAYLRLLGVTVTWRHAERIPAGRHVMVSNHCSVGDLMILFSHPRLPQRYTHLITNSLPPRVTRARHLPVIMRPASPATYDELADSPADASPIHLFPEGGMTNGRGMLRFSRGFMRILQQQQQQQQPTLQHQQPDQQHHVQQSEHEQDQQRQLLSTAAAARSGGSAVSQTLPVVPVALRVRGSLPGVSTHTLTSSFLANLFWFGFSPSTELEATALPPMAPLPGEARGAFVRRVQAAIAAELGVEVYDMTIQQKRQLAGRGRA